MTSINNSESTEESKNDDYLRSGEGDEVGGVDFTTRATKSSSSSFKVLRVRCDKQH